MSTIFFNSRQTGDRIAVMKNTYEKNRRLRAAAIVLAVAGVLLLIAAVLVYTGLALKIPAYFGIAVAPDGPAETSPSPNLCSHPYHDPDTQLCAVCGEKVCHDYSELVCGVCGKRFVFEQESIAPDFFGSCVHPGTVETLDYSAGDYISGRTGGSGKQMNVYLPYGYSPEEKYNVVFLLAGTGNHHTYWFGEDHPYRYPDGEIITVNIKDLFDNMIDRRLCRPFIAVSITQYLNEEIRSSGENYARDAGQLSRELVNDIIPALYGRYGVYPPGERDHYAFIGASAGSIIGVQSALMKDFGSFSRFGVISGCAADSSAVADAIHSEENSGLPIGFLFACAGESDRLREGTEALFKGLRNRGIADDVNSAFVAVRSASHEDRVWFTGIYDCVQFFF